MKHKAANCETLASFKELEISTNLPIVICVNPVDNGIYVSLDMFEKLLEYENVEAVKDTSRDVLL